LTRSVYTARFDALRTLLLEARERAGMTQMEVAKALGRPQNYMSKYEHGDRRLDLIEFIEVAEATGQDAVALLRIVLRT